MLTASQTMSNAKRKLVFSPNKFEIMKERVANGHSIRDTAKQFGIREATFRKHLKKPHPTSLGGYKRTFTREMKLKLVDYIKTLDDLFFGLSQKQLQSIAYEFATKNNICHRFNNSTKLAGEKWVREFRKRHDLSLRKLEQVSVARAMGFNKVQVDRFFTNLKAVYDEHLI